MAEKNERLAGRSQSQEREARSCLRLRFVTPYRRRVFRTRAAKPLIEEKKRELTANATGEATLWKEQIASHSLICSNCKRYYIIVNRYF